jgi:phage terminase large subunit
MELKLSNIYAKNYLTLKNAPDIDIIINRGGTRSGKSYSIMQLLLTIALAHNNLTISVVSRTLPHLRIGVMRDFELILQSFGFVPALLLNKSEHTYRFANGSIIEFFGVDNLAKVHGPQRHILFVNECNHIRDFDIIRHLLVRTSWLKLFDYNPSRHFWIDDEIIARRKCAVIDSTYLDNLTNLTASQIAEIESNKHNEKWWRVYGLGLKGQLEDSILTNWQYGEFDNTLPFNYGLDFGSRDPDALVKVAVDRANKLIYWSECFTKSGNSTEQLKLLLKQHVEQNKLIIADSAGTRTIEDLKLAGFNIRPVIKNKIVEDIKTLSGYTIIISENSYNLERELNDWVWLDKKGEIPIDANNHLIDAARYGTMIHLNNKQVQRMRVL